MQTREREERSWLQRGAKMRLDVIAEKIGARILTPKERANGEIHRVYAGDRMSDLLREASETVLLVTSLNSNQLLRLAELMDVPGICLLNSVVPDAEIIDSIIDLRIVLMSSPFGMFETCGRLYQLLYCNRK